MAPMFKKKTIPFPFASGLLYFAKTPGARMFTQAELKAAVDTILEINPATGQLGEYSAVGVLGVLAETHLDTGAVSASVSSDDRDAHDRWFAAEVREAQRAADGVDPAPEHLTRYTMNSAHSLLYASYLHLRVLASGDAANIPDDEAYKASSIWDGEYIAPSLPAYFMARLGAQLLREGVVASEAPIAPNNKMPEACRLAANDGIITPELAQDFSAHLKGQTYSGPGLKPIDSFVDTYLGCQVLANLKKAPSPDALAILKDAHMTQKGQPLLSSAAQNGLASLVEQLVRREQVQLLPEHFDMLGTVLREDQVRELTSRTLTQRATSGLPSTSVAHTTKRAVRHGI